MNGVSLLIFLLDFLFVAVILYSSNFLIVRYYYDPNNKTGN